MEYINTAYLFKCQTCRHFRSGECNTFCENGECYSPNMRMIPTADVVEVKHGEWFVKEFSYSKFITCSVCNSVIDSSYTNIDENEFDYCPYCGAKMDGTPKERGGEK